MFNVHGQTPVLNSTAAVAAVEDDDNAISRNLLRIKPRNNSLSLPLKSPGIYTSNVLSPWSNNINSNDRTSSEHLNTALNNLTVSIGGNRSSVGNITCSRSFNESLNRSARSLSPNSCASMDDTALVSRLAFSRSFTDRHQVQPSRKSSSTMLDTKHIRIYMKRQNSRGSINSTASVGLGDAFSSSSRPVSAESTAAADNSSPCVNSRYSKFVLPITTVTTGTVPGSRPSIPLSNNAFGASKSIGNQAPIPRSSSIPAGLGGRLVANSFADLVCRPVPYLYMGGIEAANNANLLCRLNIESIVDVSNIERQKLPREKRSDCPCLCSLETAHSRSFFTVYIDESSSINLLPTFEDVNEFIEKARSCGRSVLIHSYHGRNRSAVFVVQHLVKVQQVPLYRAIQIVKNIWPVVNISENFYRSLKRWESACFGNDNISSNSNSGHSSNKSPKDDDNTKNALTGHGFNIRTSTQSIIPANKRSAWM